LAAKKVGDQDKAAQKVQKKAVPKKK